MRTSLFLLTTFFTLFLNAQTTFTYSGIGDWTDQENWSPSYPGTTINEEDEAIISEGSEVTTLSITVNGTLTNNGILVSRSSFRNNGAVINKNTFTNSSAFYNEGNTTNDGEWNSNSFFFNENTITNNVQWNCNSFFVNNATIANNGTFNHNSFFYGNNTSHTNDFELSSIFSPGNNTGQSVGTYIFDDNLLFRGAARLTSDIGSVSEVDLIQVAGTATISGTLTVNLLNDYDPEIGSSYTILTASSITGAFSTLNFPDLSIDKEFQITYNSNSIVLEVMESQILNISDLDTNTSKITLYPNPSPDIIYIDGLKTSVKVGMYSVLGTKLEEYILHPLENYISIDTLSKGTYFLSIGNKSYPFIKK